MNLKGEKQMQKIFPDRPTMRFDQNFIARVVSVADPKGQLRVQVRAWGVHPEDHIPDKSLPWAELLYPPGSRDNEGFVTSLSVGDYVWIDFPFAGNPRRPRIIGSVHFCPGGVPNAPHESWAGPAAVVHRRTGPEPLPAARHYYENNVYSQGGIVVEIVPTADGSLIVTQRATGTAIEITPQGDITIHSEGNIFGTATKDLRVVIAGDADIQIAGNATANIGGDLAATVGKNGVLTAAQHITIQGQTISFNP
jgi:hypothetical protein